MLAKEIQVCQLNLWYIWTFASMMKDWGDVADIATVLGFFDRYLDKNYFDVARNFIHVLNPYSLYPRVVKEREEIRSFKRLADGAIGEGIIYMQPKGVQSYEGIDLEAFVGAVTNVLSEKRRAGQLIESVGEELLRRCNGKRPRNLFAIPVYDPEVVGFTDTFVQEPPGQIANMKEDLGSIAEYVERFINALVSSKGAA
jgi:hypothetical protein